MSSTLYISLIILMLATIGFVTRGLPFFFTKKMKDSQLIMYLGEHLPTAIIFLLTIYYMVLIAKPAHWHNLPHQIIAIVVVIACHWCWRNVVLSISTGTAVYLLLEFFYKTL